MNEKVGEANRDVKMPWKGWGAHEVSWKWSQIKSEDACFEGESWVDIDGQILMEKDQNQKTNAE